MIKKVYKKILIPLKIKKVYKKILISLMIKKNILKILTYLVIWLCLSPYKIFFFE